MTDTTPNGAPELNEQPQGVAFANAYKAGWEYLRENHSHGRWDTDDETPDKCWQNFWIKSVFEGREPTLDEIKAELSDYHAIMHDAAVVYDEVSGGRISKPNTRGFEVIREYEQRMTEEYQATEQKIAFALRSKEVKKFLPDLPEEEVESLAQAIMEEWYGYDRD